MSLMQESKVVECRDAALELAADAVRVLQDKCPKPSLADVEACALALKLQSAQLFAVGNEMRSMKIMPQELPGWLR